MEIKIEETKLTPEILNTFCRICAESDPDEPYGEDCPIYKKCLEGYICDPLFFEIQEVLCPCEDRDEYGTPICEACERTKEIDEHGKEHQTTSYNVFKCITCAIKSGELKL